MATVVMDKGTPLEARVQRIFMCQGAFAERGLLVRATKGDAKLVTDIDVVVHDYSINFHHRRIYAECKGGKNRSPLDRTVWVKGIKEAISADYAYLVIDRCDASTVSFAKTLGVEILQHSSLLALEHALKIGPDFWPGRTNLLAYSKFDDAFRFIVNRQTRGGVPEWLFHASEIWRDASALSFSYGKMNSLIGILERSAMLSLGGDPKDEDFVMNYAIAALLVRLCQYVLFCASDTLAMTYTSRERYLAERFTVGNLDLEQSRSLLESATKMVRAQLKAQGQNPPESWQVDHLLAAPPYARPFAEVVERCIAEGDKLRQLPLAMELRLFGYGGDEKDSGRFMSRIRPCMDLTGLIIAFARQSLNIPDEWMRGPLHYVAKSAVSAVAARANGDKEPVRASMHFIAGEVDPGPSPAKETPPKSPSGDEGGPVPAPDQT
jgi:hypothetical protein